MSVKVLGVSAELAVLENVLILFVAYFVEIIHVELADEGGEVAVSEVHRQDLLLEPLHLQNREVRALLVPDHDIGVGIVLNGVSSTSRISKVLAMKMEGPFSFSFRQRPLRMSSRQSPPPTLLPDFFYSSYISKVRLNIF
jgi:hypothetical protein